MSTNNFKAFGIGAGANVTSQSDYEALAALLTGFQSGKASSAQINKALRQSTTMAYVLAQFISDSAAVDVLDNGTPATILANLKKGMTSLTPGRLIGVQIITSSGTYTPTPGAKTGKVRGVGGGGGGGGCPSTSTGQQACANGGLSGGYAEVQFDITASSYAVTIGAAGAAGTKTPTAGGDGGSTILAGIVTIPGGPGGGAGAASTSTVTVGNIGASSIFPTVSSGKTLISLPPAPGEPFITLGSSAQQQRGGRGGSNLLGVGGAPGSGSPGVAGKGYGSGGGGCSQYASNAGDVGGAGMPGILIIEEYA